MGFDENNNEQQVKERNDAKEELQRARQEQAEIQLQLKQKEKENKEKIKNLEKALTTTSKGYSKAQLEKVKEDQKQIETIVNNVNEEWNKSRVAILQASKYLYEAKSGMKAIHGASWSFMVREKLPFGVKTADRLVEIGGCGFIHDNADDLPAAYTTLYEIAKMDEDIRQQAFDDGKINASCWRKDILDIVNGVKKQEREKEEEGQVRTVPIGILNVPQQHFRKTIDGKDIWDAEAIKLFQAECVNSLKDTITKYKVSGAPNLIDFSSINKTLDKQEERLNKKEIVDYAKEQKQVMNKIEKEIKIKAKKMDIYTGSKEKVQNMHDDLLSNYDLHSLVWALKEVGDPDDWKQFSVGHITEDYLTELANKEPEMETPGK